MGDTFRKGRVALLSSTVFGCMLVVFAFSRQVVLALLLLLLVLGLLAGVYLALNTVLFPCGGRHRRAVEHDHYYGRKRCGLCGVFDWNGAGWIAPGGGLT